MGGFMLDVLADHCEEEERKEPYGLKCVFEPERPCWNEEAPWAVGGDHESDDNQGGTDREFSEDSFDEADL